LYTGNAVSETFGVIVSKAVFLQALLLACGVLVFRGLNGFDYDIERAEPRDLCHCVSACAFADGEHRDNGCDAEDDAKRGKRRAEAMEPQALNSEFQRSFGSI
jgi:hypothetical protein